MSHKPCFPERTDRLNHFVEGLNISQDFPLLKGIALQRAQVEQLAAAVGLFIVDTLQTHYKKVFDVREDILTTYREEIIGLPNVTPNGLFLPKRETNITFNAVCHVASMIVDSLGIYSRIDRIHAPISLRLVNGASEASVDMRPRASTKIHLDIWAGEPTHAYMVFIPLLGDTDRNGVGFYEPTELPERFLGPLEDYSEGARLIENSYAYDAHFRKGEILFVDPFLLHKTLKKSPSLRLSLEFRVLPKGRVSSDREPPRERMGNYIDYDSWRDIGRTSICITDAPLQEFRGEDKVKNEYASAFRIKSLIGE